MRKHLEDSPIPDTHFIEIEDFEFLCFNFTRDKLSFSEPIPDYSTRNNSLLESALSSPKQMFGGKFLYPTLAKKAAILFYSLIKNHPFQNGNKRIAVISLLVFLDLNEQWLVVSAKNLYKIAILVSESNPQEKDRILKKLEEMLEWNFDDF